MIPLPRLWWDDIITNGWLLELPIDRLFIYNNYICRKGVGCSYRPETLREALDALFAAKALTDPAWKLPERYLPR